MEKRLLAQTADRIAALERERDEARARAAKLHAALRRLAIVNSEDDGEFLWCEACQSQSVATPGERHKKGCLAAPEVP